LGLSATHLLDQRLPLFPLSARLSNDRLTIAGLSLDDLAREYGTPLYLYDQATLDAAVQDYRASLTGSYPGPSGLTYAGKAYLSLAMAQWTQQHGLLLDCTGAGEISIAVAAGVPRQNILVHGVNKSLADLQAALSYAGTVVVDNLGELQRITTLLGAYPHLPDLWLRLRPGLAVQTHSYTQTGQDDSKFGLGPAELLEAIHLCQIESLPLTGLHFHQGSHFHDPAPIGPALDTALDLVEEAKSALGWTPQILSPGGGWGVPYHEDDLPHQPVENYVRFVAGKLSTGCRERGLPLPRLQLEPGRSIVARAGVALYRVDTVKTTPHRRWLLLDGGLADNPRPALYGARYSALPTVQPDRLSAGPAWLAGPYCESGDILIHELPMADIQPGETLAIPVSGAYHLSMSSNYNGALKPAVVWLSDGQARLIQRRETLDDLIHRDMPFINSSAPG
jgi:diaminopimelate decarboxylase